MKRSSPIQVVLSALLALSFSLSSVSTAASTVAAAGEFPRWAYDAGPDLSTSMGKELVDLNSRIPNFPELSNGVIGRKQKFRPAFGPIPWRMLQKPNSVKILFIGQDGTHIAEAAGRPATAGFGGRAQDLAKYFGVSSSAAFINTYAFTIKGQYGAFETPIVRTDANGKPEEVGFGSFVDNPLWLVSQDLDSPLVQWRNGLIDWIIRNNKDSLKMIVLFGGAARDAASAYVISKGGAVGSRVDPADLASVRIPETEMESAGGNNETPVPQTPNGEDFYAKLLGKKQLSYLKPEKADIAPDLDAAQKALIANPAAAEGMVFSRGGLNGSGILNPAQLGGYDLNRQMEIGGRKTISLKGLRISDDVTIDHDLLVVQLPHPTALSTMKPDAAAEAVGRGLAPFKPYVAAGWKIEPDAGLANNFAAGKPYAYARADMGPEYYDFGAPASRMVNVSTAVRLDPNTIVFGTRSSEAFEEYALDPKTKKKIKDPKTGKPTLTERGAKMMAAIEAMKKAKASQEPSADEMWTTRPRLPETRYVFDAGPGEKYARIMKENLPQSLVDAHPANGDFGHYRGTFRSPKVVIVADPAGYDDLITARALTGTRGQYLHGLMRDLGVGDQYLVLKTAPFGFEPSDLADWNQVLEQTRAYREKLLDAVLADGKPALILADGEYAAREVRRILGDRPDVPVVVAERSGADAEDMRRAGEGISQSVASFRGARAAGKRADIPRSHLSYYARLWEGTSGDRVITSLIPEYRGVAFAEVAPTWATSQKAPLDFVDTRGIQRLKEKLQKAGLRGGGESISDFSVRIRPETPRRSAR